MLVTILTVLGIIVALEVILSLAALMGIAIKQWFKRKNTSVILPPAPATKMLPPHLVPFKNDGTPMPIDCYLNRPNGTELKK